MYFCVYKAMFLVLFCFYILRFPNDEYKSAYQRFASVYFQVLKLNYDLYFLNKVVLFHLQKIAVFRLLLVLRDYSHQLWLPKIITQDCSNILNSI